MPERKLVRVERRFLVHYYEVTDFQNALEKFIDEYPGIVHTERKRTELLDEADLELQPGEVWEKFGLDEEDPDEE